MMQVDLSGTTWRLYDDDDWESAIVDCQARQARGLWLVGQDQDSMDILYSSTCTWHPLTAPALGSFPCCGSEVQPVSRPWVGAGRSRGRHDW